MSLPSGSFLFLYIFIDTMNSEKLKNEILNMFEDISQEKNVIAN